ncbi:hypothetical protein C8Q79DRAFT_1012457 [Trametes meyenii]|nr:hypothetical protein C8Q79DRAFT_1012457 [Trametes meyenii]
MNHNTYTYTEDQTSDPSICMDATAGPISLGWYNSLGSPQWDSVTQDTFEGSPTALHQSSPYSYFSQPQDEGSYSIPAAWVGNTEAPPNHAVQELEAAGALYTAPPDTCNPANLLLQLALPGGVPCPSFDRNTAEESHVPPHSYNQGNLPLQLALPGGVPCPSLNRNTTEASHVPLHSHNPDISTPLSSHGANPHQQLDSRNVQMNESGGADGFASAARLNPNHAFAQPHLDSQPGDIIKWSLISEKSNVRRSSDHLSQHDLHPSEWFGISVRDVLNLQAAYDKINQPHAPIFQQSRVEDESPQRDDIKPSTAIDPKYQGRDESIKSKQFPLYYSAENSRNGAIQELKKRCPPEAMQMLKAADNSLNPPTFGKKPVDLDDVIIVEIFRRTKGSLEASLGVRRGAESKYIDDTDTSPE